MYVLKLVVLGEGGGKKRIKKEKKWLQLSVVLGFFPLSGLSHLQEVAENPVLLFCQQRYSFRGTDRYLLNINPLCSTFPSELLQKQ